MPFERPTLKVISDRILADITAKMGVQASILRRSWTSILARAFAGAVHLLYGYIQYSKEQYFADTADEDSLVRKALVYGITRNPAAFASGSINVTGLAGTTIPAGTIFVRADGQRYISTLNTDLLVGSTEIAVRAVTAGVLANLSAGSAVSLESPIAGVDSDGVVDATNEIINGADLETVNSLRERYYLRVRNPPHGGSKTDYEIWTREIPNIGKVFVYPPLSITSEPPFPLVGRVKVYFSDFNSTTTPSGPRVAEVQAYLDARKPVTATVEVVGISYVTKNFSIRVKASKGYTLTQAKDDITAELKDMFLEEAIPQNTVFLSQMNEAISRPVSELNHLLDSPVADFTLAYNEMGLVGTVTVTPLI